MKREILDTFKYPFNENVVIFFFFFFFGKDEFLQRTKSVERGGNPCVYEQLLRSAVYFIVIRQKSLEYVCR